MIGIKQKKTVSYSKCTGLDTKKMEPERENKETWIASK